VVEHSTADREEPGCPLFLFFYASFLPDVDSFEFEHTSE
jgi:hypothetical protein